MPDSSEVPPDWFDQRLRNTGHSEPNPVKYRAFEHDLAELLGMRAVDIYAAYISQPGNFDVRMTQSERARNARLRVAVVPADKDWTDLTEVASRMAQGRYPGTAVLVIRDNSENWTPRWGIEPSNPELLSDLPGYLSRFQISFDDFELQTYPYAPPDTLVELTEQAVQILQDLSARPEMTRILYQLDPRLFARLIENDVRAGDVVAIAHRRAVVNRFRKLLEDAEFFNDAAKPFGGSKEKVWQQLLEQNPCILGVSLAGQLLTSWSDEKLEQVVAGFSISSPGKRADAVMRTNGRIRAMVFAEIKHHNTDLLSTEPRAGCWAPSQALSEGIVQIQRTVHLASRQIGERLSDKDDTGADTGEHTYMVRPRSFLILGNLEELRGPSGVHQDKYESFELYRRNLYEPEIITYDELLARAEWYVETLDDDET